MAALSCSRQTLAHNFLTLSIECCAGNCLGKLIFQVGSSGLHPSASASPERWCFGESRTFPHALTISSIFCISQYSVSTPFHYSPRFLSLTNVYAHTYMFWFATSFNSSVLRKILVFISEDCKAFLLQCLLFDSRRTLSCERSYSKSIAFPSF